MRLIAMAAVIVLAISAAAAAQELDRHPGHDVIWSQLPIVGGTGYASQLAPDYPFYAESANDFVVLDNAAITHVHWWGTRNSLKSLVPTLSIRETGWSGARSTRSLDCTGAGLAYCGLDSLAGDNTSGNRNADAYSCVSWNETGPEIVYEMAVTLPGTYMSASLSDLTADLDIFLLSSCSEDSCLAFGDNAVDYTFTHPGTYYIVVDGYYGATSTYTLRVACPNVPDLYFAIRFYGDPVADAEGRPAPPYPGECLYTYYTTNPHEAWDAGLSTYSYWADIPPFPVEAGHHYWFSVQSVLQFYTHGQWYWDQSATVEQLYPVMDFATLGVPRWTTFPDVGYFTDVAFELATIDSPVERTSWGAIKAMYR
jgi:hypothetical protein